MGKSSPSPPPPPNPAATGQAQSAANVDTASAQAALDYVNQQTPYGSTSYSPTGTYTTPSGETVPTYTQTTSLSPLSQQILTGQQNLALTNLPNVTNLAKQAGTTTSVPLNFNTPYSSTLNEGPQLLNKDAVNAVYGQESSFLDPQWQTAQKQLNDQLSQQGITAESNPDAYNAAMQQFNASRTQAYQSAQDTAIAQGTNNASQLFNLALQGQAQNVGQQQLAQTNPITLMQALLGGTPQTPTQPITSPANVPVASTDLIGATGISTNAAQQQYQAQIAQQNAQTGGAASLLGTLALAAALA